jgi:hypothetical protein
MEKAIRLWLDFLSKGEDSLAYLGRCLSPVFRKTKFAFVGKLIRSNVCLCAKTPIMGYVKSWKLHTEIYSILRLIFGKINDASLTAGAKDFQLYTRFFPELHTFLFTFTNYFCVAALRHNVESVAVTRHIRVLMYNMLKLRDANLYRSLSPMGSFSVQNTSFML